MTQTEKKNEIKNEIQKSKESAASKPKFPKIKTRVKAGGPWRRY